MTFPGFTTFLSEERNIARIPLYENITSLMPGTLERQSKLESFPRCTWTDAAIGLE